MKFSLSRNLYTKSVSSGFFAQGEARVFNVGPLAEQLANEVLRRYLLGLGDVGGPWLKQVRQCFTHRHLCGDQHSHMLVGVMRDKNADALIRYRHFDELLIAEDEQRFHHRMPSVQNSHVERLGHDICDEFGDC